MHLKGDQDMHLNKVLKKYNQEHWYDSLSRLIPTGAVGAASLKRHYIMDYVADEPVEDWRIDLKDPTTWGGESTNMPPDEFFIKASKAIQMDEKRAQNRASYEF